jgi:hypothetical protein
MGLVAVRASTIDPTQQATRNFILLKSYVEEREERREKKAALHVQPGYSTKHNTL